MPTKRPLPVLLPERLRRVPRSFAWIDLVIVAHKLARIVWRMLTDRRPFR